MRNCLPQCFGFSDSKHTVSYAKQQTSTLIELELCHRFSLAQLRKATNNFHESRIIGERYDAIVYKGCIVINNEAKEVAVMRFKMKNYEDDNLFKNEIVLLCQLHHPNLVSLIGFCYEKNEMIIVYDYMSNRSLQDHLFPTGNYKHKPPLSWKKRLEICIGAARGLHYLHTGAKYTIFHRNVKPSNILLNENWVPKITDLGLSVRGPIFSNKHPEPIETIIAGTVGYIDPRYLQSAKLTEKADVFSFGMVLLVVACAKQPLMMLRMLEEMTEDHRNKDESESECQNSIITMFKEIIQKLYANEIIDPFLKGKIAPECWNLFIDVTERCLLEEPTERPTMGEVEVELERALQLQEEADAKLTSGCEHSTECTTSIASQPQQPNNEGVATHTEINPC